MKFSDIPTFISNGNYEIDVPLHTLKRQLKRFKEDYGLELNPDFQRGNVWTKEQQIAWLEFFFRGGKTSRVIYFNCPAYNNSWNDNIAPSTMVCVDGLQRLTALLGFLNNEIPIFNTYYKDFEDVLRDATHSIKININDLMDRKNVLKWYIEINSGGTVHSKDEIDRVTKLMNECD